MIPNRLKDIKVLILDVDGVLTDGSIIYGDGGSEIKTFDVKDGLGMRLLLMAGIKICLVTGRRSAALYHRCKDLGIDDIFDGIKKKAAALDVILEKTGVDAEQIAFVGDDLPDLPIMGRVGLPIAVADAHQTVCDKAEIITSAKGGKGAVREVCEAILRAQQRWESILEDYTTECR